MNKLIITYGIFLFILAAAAFSLLFVAVHKIVHDDPKVRAEVEEHAKRYGAMALHSEDITCKLVGAGYYHCSVFNPPSKPLELSCNTSGCDLR